MKKLNKKPFDVALYLLGYRALSEYEIENKLKQKEYEKDEIEETKIKKVNTKNTDGLCPCGSGKPYEKCCGR